ncbi:MAG: helix-turn-helix transcriptional regulator [Rhodospirillales bacterium]|nr:helix-turn-helix transcriptional regulator [Rhodospirillales bacterium]
MQVRKKGIAARRLPSANAEICAAGEKSQLELQKVFGANLRAARMEAGLNQPEVAQMTGLAQQYLSLIEGGEQNLTMRTMAILAKVVDCDLVELLKHSVEASRSPE